MDQVTGPIALHRRQLARLDDAAGGVIRVTEGRVWITQEREGVDHVLGAGESFRVERPGLTVISALHASILEICAPRPDAVFSQLSLAS